MAGTSLNPRPKSRLHDWNIVMQSIRPSRRATSSSAGHRMKGSTGWIALALLITGSGDATATSSDSRGSSTIQVDYRAKRSAVDDAIDRLAPALSDGAATRLRITLNGLRQAMHNSHVHAPALARAARIELDAYARSVGASELDVDAIHLALEAVASSN